MKQFLLPRQALIFVPLLIGIRVAFAQDSVTTLQALNCETCFHSHEDARMLGNPASGFANDIFLYGQSGLHSLNLPSQVVFNFLSGSDFEQPLKARALNLPGNEIRYEDDIRTGLVYTRHLKKWNGNIHLQYEYRTVRNLVMHKDVYDLLFFGNAQFEDRKVDLGNLRFSNWSYNKLSIGVSKRVELKNNWQLGLGFGLSALQGINLQTLRNHSGYLYTAPDGEYLEMKYDMQFNIGREGGSKFTQWNGYGTSVDAELFVEKANQWRISLQAADVGVLFFRKLPRNYTGTDSVRFQGIFIENILDLANTHFDSINVDSIIKALGPTQTGSAFKEMTPFCIRLMVSKAVTKNIVLTATVQTKNYLHYYAYGSLRADFFLKKDWCIATTLGAGGYDLFNLGVEVFKQWKHFRFTLGTANLPGTVMPMFLPGASVYLMAGVRF